MSAPSNRTSRYVEIASILESGTVELLTTDVFDTLVWRPVATPSDLFVVLAGELAARGVLADDIDPVEFSSARQVAERRARLAARAVHGADECTLEEIWGYLPSRWFGATDTSDLIAAELACEARHLGVHEGAVELVATARARQIPTIAISDTYLSPDQLGQLMGAAGVDTSLFGEIVTSSAWRLGKAHGLIGAVVDRSGVPAARVLHVGDNPRADIEAAHTAGVRAELSEVVREVTAPDAALVAFSDRSGSDATVSASIRATLLAAGPERDSAAYQFGVGVVGPALSGFAGWASATCEELGAATLHCLLREGQVIADLVERLRPNGPATRLVHASRWALTRASVFDGTADEVLAVLERRTMLRPGHVVDAFDVDPRLVAEVLRRDRYDHFARVEAIEAIVEHDELRAAIVAQSARLRRAATSYLSRTLDLEGGPLVVCDIGWGGKIQESLERLLRADGYDGDVVGLYLMLSETGVRRARLGARMLGYLPVSEGSAVVGEVGRLVQFHAALLERVATPEIGTLLGFDDGGQPVCLPDDHDAQAPSLLLARRGVYDIAEQLAQRSEVGVGVWADSRFRAALLDAIATSIASPSAALATELSSWVHDDVAGTDATTLTAGGFDELAPYLNAADASRIGWDEVFWLTGAVAPANPETVAQLATALRGVDPATLVASSPAGEARVAAFPVGSSLASHQTEGVPALSPAGWCLLRLRAEVPSLRSVRLDSGATAHLTRLGHLRLGFTLRSGERRSVVIDTWHDRRLQWVAGRAVSATIAGFGDGGHLLLDPVACGVDPNDVCGVDIAWAFQAWPLSPGDRSLTRVPIGRRASEVARTAIQRLRRT